MEFAIAALVQANRGNRLWYSPLGVPAGRHLARNLPFDSGENWSITAAIETNLPVLPHELQRTSRRAAIGIGRGITPGVYISGDTFLAFSVAYQMPLKQLAPRRPRAEFPNAEDFDNICAAAVETVEEAAINASVAADDMTAPRPVGMVFRDLDRYEFVEFMLRNGR